jgi:hypothetical protein
MNCCDEYQAGEIAIKDLEDRGNERIGGFWLGMVGGKGDGCLGCGVCCCCCCCCCYL